MKYPILYDAKATDFFTMGLGPLEKTIEAKVTEERNGAFYLELKTIHDDRIKENMIIKTDAGHLLKDQRFIVKKITDNHDGTTDVYAQHCSYLTQELTLKPKPGLFELDGQEAMEMWKFNILEDNPFIVNSDITTKGTTNWRIDKVTNPRQALGGVEGSILSVWGGEFRFNNYQISLLKKRGTTANVPLIYGRNITGFEMVSDLDSVFTSVYPYAIQTDTEKDEDIITTIDGLVVDVEGIENYPNRVTLPVDFSSEFDDDKNKPTKAKLVNLAKKYIKDNQVGVPKINIKVNFIDLSKTADYAEYKALEEVNLCDEVKVIYPKLNVNTTAKVIRIVWNCLTEEYDELEIGQKQISLGSQINDKINDIINKSEGMDEKINQIFVSANGKNLIFYGLYGEDGLGEPEARNVGDMWYKPKGEDTEFYIWNGTIWDFIMSTGKFGEIDDKIEEAEKGIEESKKKADEGLAKAQQAIDDAGFSKDLAEKAKTDAANAQTSANQAKENATNSLNLATTAKNDASTALTNANKAIADAKKAGDTANKVSTDLTTEVDKINGQLTTKAKQIDVDTLKGKVTNNETSISQNAKEIATKAKQVDVDTLKNRVTSAETSITQNANKIALKAEKEDVKKVNDKIDNLEIGTRNLLKGTKDFSGDWKGLKLWNKEKETYKGFAVYSRSANWNGLYQIFPIKKGETYNFSFYAKADGLSKVSVFTREGTTTKDIFFPNYTNFDLTNDWVRYNYSFVAIEDGESAFRIELNNNIGKVYIAGYMLVQANKVTKDWLPAPEDGEEDYEKLSAELTVQADKIEQRATKEEVNTLSGKVSKNEASLVTQAGQIKAKANQLDVDTISGKVTSLNSELNLQSGKITSLTTKTDEQGTKIGKLETSYNGLSSTVTQLTNLKSINLIVKSELIDGAYVEANGNITTNYPKTYLMDRLIPITSEDIYMFQIWNDQNIRPKDINSRVSFYDSNKKFMYRSDSYALTGPKLEVEIKQYKNAGYFRLHFPNEKELHVMLTKGKEKPDYEPATADVYSTMEQNINGFKTEVQNKYADKTTVTQLATQWQQTTTLANGHTSQISSLGDQINLRVKKDDVVNQINLSPSGVLISGKKIMITGDTFIEEGTIREAMIGELTANKITSGTFNAANVNVINLNGRSIVSQSITGDKLAVNAVEVGLNAMGKVIKISPSDLSFYGNDGYVSQKINGRATEFYSKSVNGKLIAVLGSIPYNLTNQKDRNGMSINLKANGSFFSITKPDDSLAISWTPSKNLSDTPNNTGWNFYDTINFWNKGQMIKLENSWLGAIENMPGLMTDNEKIGMGFSGSTLWFWQKDGKSISLDTIIKKLLG